MHKMAFISLIGNYTHFFFFVFSECIRVFEKNNFGVKKVAVDQQKETESVTGLHFRA